MLGWVMRLGCGGCLGAILLTTALVGGTVGAAWMAVRSLQEPGRTVHPVTAADSARAQRKIFDVAQGSPEVVFSEREVNAFLSRNIGNLPVASPSARLLEADTVELVGNVPLRRVVAEYPFGALRDALPARALEQPIWLGVRARVTVDAWPRRSLKLDVREFRVGRQRLPVTLLRLMADPALLATLRWPVPGTIESVRVEPDRLIIRSVASR
ncbi:MAG: hypothetical protein ACRELS_15950 [Candidatus Rokuibacteriota bacterium]